MKTSSLPSITGVILAGGRAQRMGGHDKGLILFNHKPLISYAIKALSPQVDQLVINANRNLDSYEAFGYPVIEDSITGFCGPLAGMLSTMQTVKSDYILTAPCDSPKISLQLRQRMMETLLLQHADITVAHDGQRLQPVFCLIPTSLKDDLADFLANGDRKIDLWLARHKLALVNFSDQPDTFVNVNRPEDLSIPTIKVFSPVPMIGFAAFSGTGKTTLLRQLIPELRARGLEVAVIKHAHHNFDIDVPGKDSYEIRQAGAQQVLVSSSRLMALMETQPPELKEPSLAELIPRLDTDLLDLILVEGFKHETIAKIELHRPSLGKPLLYLDDNTIIAIASDKTIDDVTIEQLDLNKVDKIADFIQHFAQSWTK
ncbi:MAG: molybdenum cofactor guanylyltransferase MobA [Gammaproteobacteria bacterium]|nr:molybdenum cofactor guanylyltransferase MobA [Gammaproteobacteria bacterium]